jgi:hypothetical protein
VAAAVFYCGDSVGGEWGSFLHLLVILPTTLCLQHAFAKVAFSCLLSPLLVVITGPKSVITPASNG